MQALQNRERENLALLWQELESLPAGEERRSVWSRFFWRAESTRWIVSIEHDDTVRSIDGSRWGDSLDESPENIRWPRPHYVIGNYRTMSFYSSRGAFIAGLKDRHARRDHTFASRARREWIAASDAAAIRSLRFGPLAVRHRKQYPSAYLPLSESVRPVTHSPIVCVADLWQLVPEIDVARSAQLLHGATSTALEQWADMLLRTDNVARGVSEHTDVVRLDVTDPTTRRLTVAPDPAAFRGVVRYQRPAPLRYRTVTADTPTSSVYICDIEREAHDIERVGQRSVKIPRAGEIAPQVFKVTHLVTRVTGSDRGFIGHSAATFDRSRGESLTRELAAALNSIRREMSGTASTTGRIPADAWTVAAATLPRRCAQLGSEHRQSVRVIAALLRGATGTVTLDDTHTVVVEHVGNGIVVVDLRGVEHSPIEYARRYVLDIQ